MEFVLSGGKSNPIYFNCVGWDCGERGEFVIVDGKQRLTSLLMYLNNEFPVFKEKDPEGVGYYRKELVGLTPMLNVEVVINALPDRESVLKWYLQMNKGNVAHTKEELQKVEDMLHEIQNSKEVEEDLER